MSGGVDSSVAAAQLLDDGHDVVGATLKLWGGESDQGCCSVGDVEDARRVAQVLGIDHHVFNYTEEFEARVVDPFVRAHARAETPNPCIECNRHLKFDLLAERAWRLGFDALATGHHARVVQRDGRNQLARGKDHKKDQSYVLGFLDASVLDRLLLPVGEMTKDEVRLVAESRGLRTWDKPDSQDVCFITAEAGREGFLARRTALTPADVVDARSGEVVGEVRSAELVTVGQRRGIVPGRDGQRRYVTQVDLASRRVLVDLESAVMTTTIPLTAESLHTTRDPLDDGERILVQCSAHGPLLPATFRFDRLELDAPVRRVAPGQAVVIYTVENDPLVRGAALVSR